MPFKIEWRHGTAAEMASAIRESHVTARGELSLSGREPRLS